MSSASGVLGARTSFDRIPHSLIIGMHRLRDRALAFFGVAIAYTATMATLYLWGLMAIQGIVVALLGIALVFYGKRLWLRRDVPQLALVFLPLLVSWALFGVGGLIAMSYPHHDRPPLMGVAYTDMAVIEMALMIGIASLAYAGAFSVAAGTVARTPRATTIGAWRGWAPAGLVVVFFALDVYARSKALEMGVYFSWFITTNAQGYRSVSLLQHAQPVISALVIGLAVFQLSSLSRGTPGTFYARVFYTSIIAFELVATLLTGSRQMILKAAAVLVLARLVTGFKLDPTRLRRWQLVAIAGATLFFGWVGPAVQEARFAMDRDRVWATVPSSELPGVFAQRYLPSALHPDVVWGDRSLRSRAANATLGDRLGSYAVYGASVRQRVVDGMPPLGEQAFFDGLSTLVPRVFFPGKADMVGDEVLFLQMGVGRRYLDRSMDAGSTPTGNAYAYLLFPGLLLVMLVAGAAYGLVTRLCVGHFGVIGVLLALAFLGSAIPEGDTFTAWLAGARNAFLLFGAVAAYRFLAQLVIPGHRSAPQQRVRAPSESVFPAAV